MTVDGAHRRSAGVVHVLPGSPSGVTATGDLMYSQQTDGIGGVAESGDQFGLHLDVGQTMPTYVALLAISSAGDGSVHVIPGINPAAEQSFDQNTSGVPGSTEALGRLRRDRSVRRLRWPRIRAPSRRSSW